MGLGLAGNAVGTLAVALGGARLPGRTGLVAVGLLGALGLALVALARDPLLLGLAAAVGMVNGMGRDRGPAQTLEQAILAEAAAGPARTRAFTRYAAVQDVLGGLGALAVGVPALAARSLELDLLAAYRWTLGGAAALSLVPVGCYLALPRRSHDVAPPAGSIAGATVGPADRRRVAGLAGLFALDSLGGGFLAGAIVAYWFFARFGLDGATLGPVFLAARVLNLTSYFAAEALADRIGLMRTMVWTHLPSSLVLLALPFAGSAPLAIGLFLLREALVQMDVPTRQAYVAAVTAPGARAYALGIAGLVRNLGWAVGPALSGMAMRAAGVGAPLVIGAALKIVYDVLLYRGYRDVPGRP
ncbi:MAG TPA: hypothetical protein VNK43_13365 [Gemmatimonadales bacterium]|nr:hypothetical protein [Gemmatimonadales bacterium]